MYRTVMFRNIWYHGSDERIQGACPLRSKVFFEGVRGRSLHQIKSGTRPSRPPDMAVFVRTFFGQGGMHVSTTGLLRHVGNH